MQIDYLKSENGEKLKKLMQNGNRASRFTRFSEALRPGLATMSTRVREPTIIG